MVSIFNTGAAVLIRGKAALMSDYSKLNYLPHRRRRRSAAAAAAAAALKLDNYLETSKLELMRWEKGGPPRWFTPLECGSRAKQSPVLFFLPGIDGSGLGLQLHHKKLGEIFDIWCLHIPFSDRTPLTDLVKLVEAAIMSEHERAPERPIYLVGESLGACLALVVAAQNPQIDLILILANPVETIFWKLKMLHELHMNYLSSRLDANIKAQTLSGSILPSLLQEEDKLRRLLPNCQIRSFIGSGHPLLLENGFDLVAIIKCCSYYRRGAYTDYVLDFLQPSPSEIKAIYELPYRFMEVAVDPVMLSTLDSGKMVRGLTGIPTKGPILFVGNHMMVGMDLVPLLSRFWIEQNITVRTMAHPAMFKRSRHGKLPDLSMFDMIRILGGAPVSATNLYKLLSLNSHVLLYPGGIREAFHLKGEDYQLIWPEEAEFVRMAAKFGAKIIPFGAVGEDDVGQLLLDCDDQMKIPPLKAFIEELTDEAAMYSEIKYEIQKCIAYLKDKREKDPYRNLLTRLAYQGYYGFDSQVPTFQI
ncbi:hypothetical protein ACJIZ3_004557 [Penstemon smallii]|uniref:Uncharacterized protein n=1 Tax=Penstemon smallii TaxID=265156 RepID=A0ABD3S2G1_9LAMI